MKMDFNMGIHITRIAPAIQSTAGSAI